MSRDIMSKYRTKIIEDFINIEGYVCAIICKQYLGKVTQDFMREVLFDELFSSGLKANLFEKVLKRNKDIQKPREYADQFRQLSRYRNFFAHCNTTFSDDGTDGTLGRVPDPRNQDKYLNIEDIIKNFTEIYTKLSKDLIEIMDKMGIWFMHDDETGITTLICETKELPKAP
ncbi:MAG: hypothetical protein CDV28_1283 [Candidatus Electronema aureum]|uniref:MAE-28990/MAE-18760-like HEPN domain-containing protein n=1 Tax=Candidatus Electronema aureum TaxID=2005002 RepID=A0A521G022_9BACT|nr:MAG: hypothetical protein CDV28_1283 [Candidatus Electronema aureum]